MEEMRWGGVVLVLGACNQVFGLQETRLRDGDVGTGGEPIIDAPFMCPPSGPPSYTGSGHLWSDRHCRSYSISADGKMAAAQCSDTGSIETGPAHGALAPGSGLPSVSQFDYPRLSPEGNELFVHSSSDLRIYHLNGSTWTQTGSLPRPSGGDILASVPSMGPDRRVMLYGGQSIYEYANTGTGWTAVGAPYDLGAIGGFSSIKGLELLPDGLRFVFYGNNANFGTYYMERTSLTARFGSAVRISGLPSPYGDDFLTPNCGVAYYADDPGMYEIAEQL